MEMEAVSNVKAEFMRFKATSLQYDYRDKDMGWGVSMVVLCLPLIALCLVLNALVFWYYKRKASSDIVALLYSLMSCTDMAVGVGAILMLSLIHI